MVAKKQTQSVRSKLVRRDYVYAVGRRKEAVARVRLYTSVKDAQKWGDNEVVRKQILVNAMPIEHYFPGPHAKAMYTQPFNLTDTLQKYAVTVKVAGGGKAGQLDAVVQGIAKVLQVLDKKKFRASLKSRGLLTRDSRIRQRRKVGTGGKARRQKQSPKR